MAIECKNLRLDFPLIVQCAKRRLEESYHELLYSLPASGRQSNIHSLPEFTQTVRVPLTHTLYSRQDRVGKSCQQIGKKNGALISSNTEVYDKWSQAINSAHGLFEIASDDGLQDKIGALIAIIPILAVRDGTLWAVDYDDEGSQQGAPEQVERVSYFIDSTLYPSAKFGHSPLSLSHLEIVTETGLLKLVKAWADEPPFFSLPPTPSD